MAGSEDCHGTALHRGLEIAHGSELRTLNIFTSAFSSNTTTDYVNSFFARVATKFQDNTIVALVGQASYGPTRSQELADEMADKWGPIMLRYFTSSTATSSFLAQASPRTGLDGSALTMATSTEGVCAVMKKLKRGKAAGPNELNNTFYRDYPDEIAPSLKQMSSVQPSPLIIRRSKHSVFEEVGCIYSSGGPSSHRPA